MPDAEVWMTIGELANLFYVRGVSVEAAIRRLGEVYGMETVIALSFRFDTGQAALFRKWIARTAARSGKEPTVMFLHYPHGTYC